jgi:hypothetical protein
MEASRLRVFENRVLRKTYECKRHQATGGGVPVSMP